MSNPFDKFDNQSGNPFDRFDGPRAPQINFDRSDDEIRADIDKLPETSKQDAYKAWAKDFEAKARAKGLDLRPSPGRGIPIIGGLMDEAEAGINAGLYSLTHGNVGRPYDEGLAFARERHRAAEAKRPAEAVAGQLATGIVTGGPLASRIPAAATTLGRVAQGAGLGYGVGAVEGFTRGEGDAGKRLENAHGSGVVSATVGGALPVVGDLALRGAGAAREYLGPTFTRWRSGVEESADQILANRIARSGSTPAAIRRDLQTGQARSGVLAGGGQNASRAELPEAIADTSDDLQRLTGTLYRTGGQPGNYIRETLEGRQRGLADLFDRVTRRGTDGQHQRIMNATERALLVRTAGTARQTERNIVNQMREEGDRLYRAAWESQTPFDISAANRLFRMRMAEYPASPTLNQMRRAARAFENITGNDLRRLDRAKRVLDDMIESAQRKARGANLVRELTQYKNNVLRLVHRNGANQDYATARAAWGSAAERREAIDLGRASLRENSEITAEQFRELTTGQQQLFRIGFLESLRNSIGSKGRGHDITRVFDQNRVRQLMSEIIPRPARNNAVFADRASRFGNIIDREARMTRTNQAAFGNSMTQRNQMDDAAFAGDALASMWNKFRAAPSLFNMGIEAVGVGIQRVFGYRQDVAMALARRLLETDPTARNQILRRLARRSPQGFSSFVEHIGQAQVALTATAPAALQIEEAR